MNVVYHLLDKFVISISKEVSEDAKSFLEKILSVCNKNSLLEILLKLLIKNNAKISLFLVGFLL